MAVITYGKNKIVVTPVFDTGQFLYFSVSSGKYPKEYTECKTNIQLVENLSFDDFTLLSTLIAQTVDDYITTKNKNIR